MAKVGLLMSGGVDSSYCAHLLSQAGHEVVGFYLKLHDREVKHKVFISNCREVAKNLNLEFHVVDFSEEFKRAVYDEFVAAYKDAKTPNPCTLCNPNIKFGLALQKVRELGCELIASGHYAQITQYQGKNRILKARDANKDQSYFLYALSQDALDSVLFPLGAEIKADIKPIALELLPFLGSLETYKDSQEICFVENSYIDVLKKHVKVEQEGVVRDTSGKVIGKHKGYMQYTIGKRKGFDVKGALEAHYVKAIDPIKNELIVGTKEELGTRAVSAMEPVLMEGFKSGEYEVKIRHRSAPTRAFVSLEDGILRAEFMENVYGVANGQALVVYDGDVVLGGGVII